MIAEDEKPDRTQDIGELVGGPLDGQTGYTLGMDVVSYNTAVYQRSYRQSTIRCDIWCYDYIGEISDPEIHKVWAAQWE